jgi:hypothetical protein
MLAESRIVLRLCRGSDSSVLASDAGPLSPTEQRGRPHQDRAAELPQYGAAGPRLIGVYLLRERRSCGRGVRERSGAQ